MKQNRLKEDPQTIVRVSIVWFENQRATRQERIPWYFVMNLSTQ